MKIKIDCPVCADGKKHDAEVLKVRKGKFVRGRSEFNVTIMIVRCLDCNTVGLYKKVDDLGMENYEFPYEGDID